jgi:hypothetical protein
MALAPANAVTPARAQIPSNPSLATEEAPCAAAMAGITFPMDFFPIHAAFTGARIMIDDRCSVSP